MKITQENFPHLKLFPIINTFQPEHTFKVLMIVIAITVIFNLKHVINMTMASWDMLERLCIFKMRDYSVKVILLC